MRSETIFKSGMALAYIAEIIFLCLFMYMAFTEFDGTSVEMIGFNMVIICGVVGSGAMLWGLYEILKWKAL